MSRPNPLNMPDTVPDDVRRTLGDYPSRVGELVARRYFEPRRGSKVYAQIDRRDLAMLCATAAHLAHGEALGALRDVLAFFETFDGDAFREIDSPVIDRARAMLARHEGATVAAYREAWEAWEAGTRDPSSASVEFLRGALAWNDPNGDYSAMLFPDLLECVAYQMECNK